MLSRGPSHITNEEFYRRYYAHFPAKRLHIEDRDLYVGLDVSVKGFSATIVEVIPSALDPAETCVICLDQIGDTTVGTTKVLVSRSCGHAFHRLCIQKWRHETHDWVSKKASCPTCRASVKESDIVFPFDQWRVVFSDGSDAVVSASEIKTPPPVPTPFNPRHRNDFMYRERTGDFQEILPKRSRYDPR